MSVKARFGFVVEYVADIEAAKRFYVEVMGLEMERYHPTYVQFGAFAIANDESMSGGSVRAQTGLSVPLEKLFRTYGAGGPARWGPRAYARG